MKKYAWLVLGFGLGACGDNGGAGPSPDGGPDAAAPAGPRITFFDYPIAVDVSPDGHTALFERFEGAELQAVFVDVATGDSTTGPTVGDPSKVMVTGIADSGRISALHDGVPTQAAIWTEADDWTDLPSPYNAGCDQDVGGAFDLSGDGAVVVGLMWNGCNPAAFRWTEASGVTEMEVLGASNRASVISDDGAIAAGFAQTAIVDRKPAIWTADGDGTFIDPNNDDDTPGEILSINGDGSVAAGIRGYDGFTWTEAGGMVTMPRLDIALPTDPMFPNAMTADGTRVFGASGDAFFGTPIAFVWTADGIQPLADTIDVELPEGTILNNVLGVSADGTVLIGTAMDADFATKTFLLVL